eukprot:6857003-Prymnesium_polylepis.1
MPKKRGKSKGKGPAPSVEAAYSYDASVNTQSGGGDAEAALDGGTPLLGHRIELNGLQSKPHLNGELGQ